MSSSSKASEEAARSLDHSRRAFESAREAFLAGKRAVPDLARDAQERLGKGFGKLKGQGREAADHASDQFDDAREYVVDQVHERPLTVTFAAIAVGFILGLLFSGRRS